MDKRFKSLKLKEVIVFKPQKLKDSRGFFYENFNVNDLSKISSYFFKTVQENISKSKLNTLRGLHYQRGQFAQSKIVNVIKGKILDVVVDIRPRSKNFSKWVSYTLDDKSNESLFIPSGFAHGFFALEDETIVSYKVDKPYNVNAECSILWNDKYLNIKWPNNSPLLSLKDKTALTFEENQNFVNE